MPEVLIIHNQIQQSSTNTVVQSHLADQFVENLRVGQNLKAQLVVIENKYWLVTEDYRIAIPKETVEQWNLVNNQTVKLKITSLANPLELQLVNKPLPRELAAKDLAAINSSNTTSKNNTEQNVLKDNLSLDSSKPLVEQKPLIDIKQLDHLKKLTNLTATAPLAKEIINTINQKTDSTKQVQIDKVDTNKLISEARKFLNNPMLDSKALSAQSIKSTSAASLNEQLTKTISDGLQSLDKFQTIAATEGSKTKSTRLIAPQATPSETTKPLLNSNPKNVPNISVSNSKVTTENVNVLDQTSVITKSQSSINMTVTDSIKDSGVTNTTRLIASQATPSETTKPLLKSNSKDVPNIPVSDTRKDSGLTNSTRLITPQATPSKMTLPLVKSNSKDLPNTPVSNSKITSENVNVSDKTAVITKSQSSINMTVSDTGKDNGLTNSTPIASKPMKFEIAVSLPDSERFPVLADKMTRAYNRQLEIQKPANKSLNNLLSQLIRLNQWSADNKASRRTQGGAQVEKLAASLKESLKDMFRYISPKESLKTGKSVEKAIQQSGTFLEKRIAKQDIAKKDILNKSSAGLTIHKDYKANLNRVLATALYNLAKLNSATSTTKNTAEALKNLTASTQTDQKILNAQKQLSDSSSLLKANLLNNIRSSLIKLSSGRSAQINITELQSITKQVLKDTQSALGRTQLSQLTNLRPETAPQQWLFELPVFNGNKLDIFNLYMKQHSKEHEDEETKTKKPGWSIVLQFDIGPLGKIRAMLSWADNAVQVRFIAENENTVSLVDDQLNYFQNKLTENDISFEQLSVEKAQLDDLNYQFSKGNSDE
ncbi:MAG: hypothetical protein ACI9IA_000304 [Enterobacterales bacterium]|jgi:hypothetical protein